MAQQGKQMIVGACEGFPYQIVKLGLLTNGNRYGWIPTRSFLCGKAFYPFKVLI
jgi:hypothetical protein